MSLLGKQDLDILVDEVKQDINRKVNAIKGDLFAPSENTKLTTVNGVKEFTCEESGYIDNVYLEGETLVNIAPMSRKDGSNQDGVVRTRFNTTVDDSFNANQRISDGTFTLYNFTDKAIFYVGQNSSLAWGVGYKVPAKSCIVVNVPATDSLCGVDFSPIDGWSNSDMNIYTSNMYMVLEGEHPYMPYFKGISSVGQGDKIKLLTQYRGANIIPSNISTEKDKCVQFNDGQIVDMLGYYLTDYIGVEPNTQYIFADVNMNIAYYDENKVFIPMPLSKGIGEAGYTYFSNVSPSNAKYIRLSIKDIYKTTPCLFKGDYLYDEQQISTTLNGVLDDVKDLVYKVGNKYYKLKKCGKYTLTGFEKVNGFDNNSSRKTNLISIILDVDLKPLFGICDKYKYEPIYGSNYEHFYLENAEHFKGVTIEYIRDSGNTKESYMESLKTNPVTIVYQLNTPIVIELPNFNPRTFKGKNAIVVDTNSFPKDISFDVTTAIRNEMEVVKDKVNSAFLFGSNVKNDLADKLTSVGVPNMSVNNTFAELIASIPIKGTDVKIATGQIIVPVVNTKQFNVVGSSELYNRNYIELNLGFKPNHVVIMPKANSYACSFLHDTPYRYQESQSTAQPLGEPWVFCSQDTTAVQGSSVITYLRANERVYVSDTTIHVPVMNAPTGGVFYYTAVKYK